MKMTSRRGFVVLLLVVAVVAGLGFLGFKLAVNGENWATLRANEHLTEDGSFIAAGHITDRNGEILAKTENNQRVYNDSERIRRSTLHIVGDTEGYISSGVQTAYKTQLIGYNHITGLHSLIKNGRGNDVKLTLDSELCAVAYDKLNGRKGVVAAYNYETGELLCSVSSGNYDIRNKPSSEEIAENKNGQYDGIYMNRLIDGLYTPGSTFKIVTAASVIENKKNINDWEYICEGETTIDGVKVTCPHSHGKLSFKTAFSNSCNCAFAELSEALGSQKLTATANEFGFGESFSFGKGQTEKSRIDLSEAKNGDVAWAGVGQYTTLVNPYHMLTLVGSVANGGTAVLPYTVASISTPEGRVVEETVAVSREYISPDVAKLLKEMMRFTVEDNYGDWRFKGLEMCGKTGTAEISDEEEPHSWFVGFSGNSDCPVAIVVVVENGGWGSSAALPIASSVMESVYKTLA
ncbi:MAG: penicillin-binding protein [Ruminococcaceae bacterium]|nr:penicillin-binding protein [Oscillospiraceae bacterium]